MKKWTLEFQAVFKLLETECKICLSTTALQSLTVINAATFHVTVVKIFLHTGKDDILKVCIIYSESKGPLHMTRPLPRSWF